MKKMSKLDREIAFSSDHANCGGCIECMDETWGEETMNTTVTYFDPKFAAIVRDSTGREYRFHFVCDNWFVEERIYWDAEFYRS